MNGNVTWVEPQGIKVGIPKWLVTAGISDEGTVFVAARIAGNELAVTLAANFDNVPQVVYRGHPFVPVDWMAREYPKTADDLRFVELRVRDAAEGDSR